MHSIYVKDVIRLCNGKLLCGDENLVLSNFCTDTRKLKPGDVYVGMRGDKIDGSDFYSCAIEKGASCLILSKVPEEKFFQNVTILVVEDTLVCVQKLAHYKRSLYDIPVIAITGSVGKTSTKDIVASVVEQKYKTHKTSGNFNNHLGLPLTILGLHEDDEALVVEMGMNHLGEISLLSNIAKPTISIITNVGTAHIGNLGSRENILKAKLEILEGMIGKDVILNHDNDMLAQVEDELRDQYDLITISVDEESTYQAVCLKEKVFDSKFDILGYVDDVTVNVGGRAFIYNSLVAYAVGKVLNIADDDIKKGISEFKLTGGRLERKVTKKGVTLIDDTYNANYDSMKASIELLGKVEDKRKIAVLGDMLELGDYSSKLHIQLGDVVFQSHIDYLITIGNYSKFIDNRVLELGMDKDKVIHFDKEDDSYSYLDELLCDKDIVLLKGSHGIELDKVVNYLMRCSFF